MECARGSVTEGEEVEEVGRWMKRRSSRFPAEVPRSHLAPPQLCALASV
jgi:hypothetical protein